MDSGPPLNFTTIERYFFLLRLDQSRDELFLTCHTANL
jgi:hypothetical protein